jgi:hypothetical protein
MSITKAGIVSFVNSAIKQSYSADALDEQIQDVLYTLCDEELLLGRITDQSIAAGDLSFAWPTACKGILEIVLNDGSLDGDPLVEIGREEYLMLMNGYTTGSRTTPTHYNDHDKTIYLWPVPQQAFTGKIDYAKYHAEITSGTTDLDFDDEFRRVIRAGVCHEAALLIGRERYIRIWGAKYQLELQRRIDNAIRQPSISRG